MHLKIKQTIQNPGRTPGDGRLYIGNFKPVTDGKSQKKHQPHNPQKDGQPPHRMSKQGVYAVGALCLFFFFHQHFRYNFFNKVILLIDKHFFVTAVKFLRQPNGVALAYLLVPLQQLDCMPTVIWHIWITLLQYISNNINFILN